MRTRYTYWVALGACLALLACLCACAPPPAVAPTATADAAPTARPALTQTPVVVRLATLAPLATMERVIVDNLSEEGRRWVTQARQDLLGRLNVASDKISLVKAEAVQWPDSSLGCAEPGMMYAQAITPGYRVVLEFGGQQYDYHVGNNRMTLCELKK